MNTTAESSTDKRRNWWAWGIVAVIAAGVIGTPIVMAIVDGQRTDGAAAPTSQAPTPSAAPTPTATVAATPTLTASPTPSATTTAPTDSQVAPELDPVQPDEDAVTQDGVVFTLADIEAVEGEAFAPGEIAGPAVRVTITVVNDSGAALDLSQVAVNAYVGADRIPAGTISEPGGAAFGGTLEVGASANGVYLFSIPVDQRDDVLIGVDYQAGHPTVTFRGDMAG